MNEDLKRRAIEIKKAVSLADIIRHYSINVKKEKARCPFHDDKNPSMAVKSTYWKCYPCNIGGTQIDFVMKMENLDFKGACQFIEETFNIKESERMDFNSIIREMKPIGDKLKSYLKDVRKISEETIRDMKLKESDGWFVFAMTDNDNNVIGLKYLKYPEKNFRLEKGSRRSPINYHRAKKYDTLIIVEGEMDMLSVYEAGFPNVISAPNGASNTDFMESVDFSKFTHIQIAVDNDEPGEKFKENLIKYLGGSRCYIANFPDDCKDASDVLVKHGAEKLQKCLESPFHVGYDGVTMADDVLEDMVYMLENGEESGVDVGFSNLKEHYNIQTGLFTVVTGVPSSGKSEFVNNIAMNLAENHGWKFAFYSPENYPYKYMYRKLNELHTRLSFVDNYKREKMTVKELAESNKWVNDHFFGLNNSKMKGSTIGMPTVTEILNHAVPLIVNHGVKGIILDPFNKFDQSRQNWMTTTEWINTQLAIMSDFAREHNIHLWLIAHPTKIQRESKYNYKRPVMYDISGSSNFYNVMDFGIVVHRTKDPDGHENPVIVDIQKVRFKWHGVQGEAYFKYDFTNGRYEPTYEEPNIKQEYKI